jgi:uncharacterized protein (TIGR02452 family)
MANREERARLAAETAAITRSGTYVAPSGRTVSIADSAKASADASTLFTPSEATGLRSRADAIIAARESRRTTFSVRNEGTFTAARRLGAEFGGDKVAALNFASAKNPGGGFLGGSQAQEESLARASALVATLERHMGYYDANRKSSSLLYTDHMIVSPRVPVFRDEEDRLLEHPWEVTIITSPAPNAGAIGKKNSAVAQQVVPTFRRRIEQVLSAAVVFDQSALVLGAWGCGVFGNDPATVAGLFGEFLLNDGPFAEAFEHIAFAVLDRTGDTIRPFAKVFPAVSC